MCWAVAFSYKCDIFCITSFRLLLQFLHFHHDLYVLEHDVKHSSSLLDWELST